MARSTIVKPVAKRSGEDRALDILRDRIVSGALAAGTRLTEQGLSEDLGIPRTMIRTALHRVATEGLVVQTPYTGWHVISFAPHDVWELYTLRSALEGLAASLAASHPGRDGETRLHEAMRGLEASCRSATPDITAISEADFGLHLAIVESSGNERLVRQYRLVGMQVRMIIAASNAMIGDPRDILVQHESIIAPILAGDPAAAEEVAVEHVQSEGRKLRASLADNYARS